MVETFGTSEIDPAKLPDLVHEHFDLRPAAIIERLALRRPIFRRTAAYGHFGRSEPTFTWERTDHADELRAAAQALA
jgi:S-adenosylmethionine synthetase